MGGVRGVRGVRKWAAGLAALGFFCVSIVAPLSLPGLSTNFSTAFAANGAGYEVGAGAQVLRLDASSAPQIHLGVAEATQAVSEQVAPSGALFSLDDFLFRGVINWGGYKFTFYSQQVLPGGGLNIPGRHVNAGGYVSDSDGYIVLAGSAPMGSVFETPFGYPGKIYDRGTVGNHLDVYIR